MGSLANQQRQHKQTLYLRSDRYFSMRGCTHVRADNTHTQTYASGNLVVELLQLGIRAELGAAVQRHNSVDGLEDCNVSEREVLHM
jgi:hypothetical protein